MNAQLLISLPVVVLAGFLGTTVLAQGGTRGPAVMYDGRVVGFVPAHLQGRRPAPPPRTAAAAQERSSRDVKHQPTAVVSHEEFVEAPPADTIEEDVVLAPEPEMMADDVLYDPAADGCCSGPLPWCSPLQIWGRAEYLLWWTKGMDVPALATTSPTGTSMEMAGVLGQPGTVILYGDEGLNDEGRSGGRFTLGLWLDACHCRGLDVTYLVLGDKRETFAASNENSSILARPFFNVREDIQDALRIAYPREVAGSLVIQAATRLQALEAHYRFGAVRAPCRRGDVLIGYRFTELEDYVDIQQATRSLAGPTAGSTIDLFDQFRTRNSFHGVQLGYEFQWLGCPRWQWQAIGKLALGNRNSQAVVAGQTTTTTEEGSNTTSGGLLTRASNIGSYEQNDFSVIWELGLRLRRNFPCGLSATLGYTFLFWSDVARAGEQIDFGVNPTQIPPGIPMGEPRPAFAFQNSDFWAQGLHAGLEFAY